MSIKLMYNTYTAMVYYTYFLYATTMGKGNIMKKNEIKAKAFSLFANKGYHDASMQEIAKAVGINKATLYFYFPGKAELYGEIMQDKIPELCDAINGEIATVPEDNMTARLKCIFNVFISKLSDESLIMWKRTMLMCTNEYDQSVKDKAKKLLRERDAIIAETTRGILLNRNISDEKISNYIECSTAAIRGFSDMRLIHMLDDAPIHNKESLADKAWEQFWNGGKSLLG